MNWYLDVLRRYAQFSGRARRKEFWMFMLFSVLISIVLGIIDNLIGTANMFGPNLGLLAGIYSLAVLVPSLAVMSRRLHDTNRTHWWILLNLLPLLGIIVLIVFWAGEGNRGANQYGPDPKAMAGVPTG